MPNIKRLNCRACGGTHFGLWSADGLTVKCPLNDVPVYVATGKVAKVKEEAPEKPAPKKRTRRAKKG